MPDDLDMMRLKRLIAEGYNGLFRINLMDESGESQYSFEGTVAECMLWVFEEHPEYLDGDSSLTKATLIDLREGSRELWRPEN